DDWIRLLSKHEVAVGVSIDGPQRIHDVHRLDHRGRGTYARTVKGVARLNAAVKEGTLNGGFAALCVVEPSTDPVEIFHHLCDDLNIRWMDFLLPDMDLDSIPADHSAAQYGEYFCRL